MCIKLRGTKKKGRGPFTAKHRRPFRGKGPVPFFLVCIEKLLQLLLLARQKNKDEPGAAAIEPTPTFPCEIPPMYSARIGKLLILSLVSFLFGSVGILSAETPSTPTYWQNIRPVLRKNCAFCHAERHVKKLDVSGGLALDSYQAIQKSVKKKVLKVGDSQGSLLVKLLLTDDANLRMPLDGDPLPKEQIDLIRLWIDKGLKEGEKPADMADTVVTTKPVKVRKRDVVLVTKAVPPKGMFGNGTPAALSLLLKAGPLAPVTAVAFSPDGKLLATGIYGQVTVWDLQKAQPVHVFTNVLGAINDLEFSPDGKWLAVGGGQPSAKGEWKLYQLSDGKTLATFRDHGDVVFSLDFSPDGKKLVTGSFDTTVRVWDLVSLKLEQTISGHSDFVYAVAFSPDGKTIASASKDRSVGISSVETGESIFTLSNTEEDVLSLAFHPDGRHVLSSGFDSALHWWNTKTGEQEKLQRGHREAVQELGFSQDGEFAVSASADKTMRIWNGKTGATIRAITVGSSVYAVAISPNKKWIASGSFDGMVRIWNAQNGSPLLSLLALPADEEQSDWLALTPSGYLAGSSGLSELGRWTMRGKVVEGNLVWQNLQQPEQVVQGLNGKSLPNPTFKNKK